MNRRSFRVCRLLLVIVAALPALTSFVRAQDRLKTMPGYEQYQRVGTQIASTIKSGALAVTWSEDGTSFEYVRDGRSVRYDIATRQRTDLGVIANGGRRGLGGRGGNQAGGM